ncbi:hypothetical protein TNCV_4232011 [Trichonephila clavipes]|nr:hypothetical protein TNCV_4232011 [Trichonephila clavipes]
MIALFVNLDVTYVYPAERKKHTVNRNSSIVVGIELTMNSDRESQTEPEKIYLQTRSTSSDHDSTTELNCWRNVFWKAFTRQISYPYLGIRM